MLEPEVADALVVSEDALDDALEDAVDALELDDAVEEEVLVDDEVVELYKK